MLAHLAFLGSGSPTKSLPKPRQTTQVAFLHQIPKQEPSWRTVHVSFRACLRSRTRPRLQHRFATVVPSLDLANLASYSPELARHVPFDGLCSQLKLTSTTKGYPHSQIFRHDRSQPIRKSITGRVTTSPGTIKFTVLAPASDVKESNLPQHDGPGHALSQSGVRQHVGLLADSDCSETASLAHAKGTQTACPAQHTLLG